MANIYSGFYDIKMYLSPKFFLVSTSPVLMPADHAMIILSFYIKSNDKDKK